MAHTARLHTRRFRLLSSDVRDKELLLTVETLRQPFGCPACGAVARVKDRRTVTVRDLPVGGTPVILRWRKRIFERLGFRSR